jgi:hypothetical protein
MSSPIPYTFLLGQSHSGSTLLAFLANAHPEVLSVGETNRLEELFPSRWSRDRLDPCSCGQPYYQCEFWNRSLAGLAAAGHGLGHPDSFDFKPKDKVKAQSKLAAFVRSMLNTAGKRMFFDASKHYFCLPALVDNPELDVRVVDLYRDGRGIVQSWRKNNPQTPDVNLVREFRRRERMRVDVLKGMPADRVFKLKYEDFCQAPQDVLRAMFSFMNVDPSVDVTVGYKTTAEHHIIGNQMRLNTDESIRFDEKWRTTLSDNLSAVFKKIAARTNAENGYAD